MREWDLPKLKALDRSRSRSREKQRQVMEVPEETANSSNNKPEPKTLDDLFRKTTALPSVYWLPLTDEQYEEKVTTL